MKEMLYEVQCLKSNEDMYISSSEYYKKKIIFTNSKN